MANTNAYNAVLAKARAMYGRHITSEQYQEMLRCRSVQEVAAFLKGQTHYSEALSNVAENNVHRGQLENMMRKAAFEEYSKLYHFLPLTRNSLFQTIVMEEEIREILRMVILLKAGNPQNFIIDLPVYLIHRADVDLLAVAKATKFEELIQAMNNHPYAALLRRFAPGEERREIDYIGCEHAFFEYYFRHVFALIEDNYHGQEKSELLSLLRTQVELVNVEQLFRFKQYLDVPHEDIVKSIYPHYYKIKAEQIREMAESKDVGALREVLMRTSYRPQVEQLEEGGFIEANTHRYYYEKCRSALHFTTHVSVAFYAYCYLNRMELNNIFHIVEGIRYQVPENEIRDLIII